MRTRKVQRNKTTQGTLSVICMPEIESPTTSILATWLESFLNITRRDTSKAPGGHATSPGKLEEESRGSRPPPDLAARDCSEESVPSSEEESYSPGEQRWTGFKQEQPEAHKQRGRDGDEIVRIRHRTRGLTRWEEKVRASRDP